MSQLPTPADIRAIAADVGENPADVEELLTHLLDCGFTETQTAALAGLTLGLTTEVRILKREQDCLLNELFKNGTVALPECTCGGCATDEQIRARLQDAIGIEGITPSDEILTALDA